MRRWLKRLWANDWFLYGEYVDRIEKPGSSTGFTTLATVDADYKYRKANVQISTAIMRQLSPYMQERNACHETIHLILSGYQHIFDDLLDRANEDGQMKVTYLNWWAQVDEQTTEGLTNALMQLSGKIPPKWMGGMGEPEAKHDAPEEEEDATEEKSVDRTSKRLPRRRRPAS